MTSNLFIFIGSRIGEALVISFLINSFGSKQFSFDTERHINDSTLVTCLYIKQKSIVKDELLFDNQL